MKGVPESEKVQKSKASMRACWKVREVTENGAGK